MTVLKDELVQSQHEQSPAIIKRHDDLIRRRVNPLTNYFSNKSVWRDVLIRKSVTLLINTDLPVKRNTV